MYLNCGERNEDTIDIAVIAELRTSGAPYLRKFGNPSISKILVVGAWLSGRVSAEQLRAHNWSFFEFFIQEKQISFIQELRF